MFKTLWKWFNKPTDHVFGLPPKPVCPHCGKDTRPNRGDTVPR